MRHRCPSKTLAVCYNYVSNVTKTYVIHVIEAILWVLSDVLQNLPMNFRAGIFERDSPIQLITLWQDNHKKRIYCQKTFNLCLFDD